MVDSYVRIDESLPSLNASGEGDGTVVISNRRRDRVRLIELQAVLGSLDAEVPINRVVIDASSRLTSLEFLHELPKLRSLSILGKEVVDFRGLQGLRIVSLQLAGMGSRRRDLSVLAELPLEDLDIRIQNKVEQAFVSACASVRSLTIRNWLGPDVNALRSLNLSRMNLIGGIQETINGYGKWQLSKCLFARCRNLRRVEELTARIIDIEDCRSFDLDGIGRTCEVNTLQYLKGRPIKGMGFLRNVKGLRNVVITSSKVDPSTLKDGLLNTAIRTMFVEGLSNVKVREIGAELSDLTITNGKVCYSNGSVVSIEHYYSQFELWQNVAEFN